MVDIDYFAKSMNGGPKNFVLADKGDIDKFIDIEITQLEEKYIQNISALSDRQNHIIYWHRQ